MWSAVACHRFLLGEARLACIASTWCQHHVERAADIKAVNNPSATSVRRPI